LLGKLNLTTPTAAAGSTLPDETLPEDAAVFWKMVSLPPDFLGEVHAPPVNAALPKRLGNFPFWRGDEAFQETIESLYTQTENL
jgi:uncharacterized Zn finger protein